MFISIVRLNTSAKNNVLQTFWLKARINGKWFFGYFIISCRSSEPDFWR
ncbi:hypothetical protein ymoll0001_32410 [Yersinia mollaretii ATCC 43969]|uniref:Tryptophanase leader peptide n=1 Tax=Yersinia mollaretii (strain ATCC 43969 / DSM 18520 / CIP 103324 / CNY 7263 / WAIP 204) TaxID=349967 RepID=A0ABM9Y7G5_YERMW|nr:hypothetical protein ymoll0001_32410 [Yersinia mollaretii ATCC 43969]